MKLCQRVVACFMQKNKKSGAAWCNWDEGLCSRLGDKVSALLWHSRANFRNSKAERKKRKKRQKATKRSAFRLFSIFYLLCVCVCVCVCVLDMGNVDVAVSFLMCV